MKLRRDRTEISDTAEREAEEAVRRLAKETGYTEPEAPHPVYFANLLVKTNENIDRVTSGKALSISWLARVAVPGVVAILFFFIGLHYYAPEKANQPSIADAVKTLSEREIDSLAVNSVANGVSVSPELHADVFDVSSEQLAEFYVASESPAAVVEALPEQDQKEVASILESRPTNL